MIYDTSKYTFFWKGPLNQWVKSPFIIFNKEYNTAEQFMMHCKAVLFNDHDTAKKIMSASNPRDQKNLGRQVKNFDEWMWNKVCRQIVYTGNKAKFTQNPKLLEVLLNTVGTTLVEASPFDLIWGIGLNEETAKKTDPSKWPGKNWLGLTLTKVREDILNEK